MRIKMRKRELQTGALLYAEDAEVPSVKAEYSQGKEGIPTTDHILHRYIRPGAIRRASAREGK
jgi:hypothetical protein